MKIVIAPDSFKESLSTEERCQAIRAEFSTIFPDVHCVCLPIADGGEGTVEAMVTTTGGNIVTLEVCGPMGRTVNAFYGLTGDGKTVAIEVATASGLVLVALEKRNSLLTSSFGTRELIRRALDNDVHHIILGIDGSATVDGGMGIAQALGVRFLDADGQVLAANDGNLACVASIKIDECDPCLVSCHIEVACDVDNPLVGARDAAAVFGSQKGATPKMVEELGQGLQNYAHILQQQTETNVRQMADGGAAGGMGTAVTVFLNADIKPDVEIVLNVVNLTRAVQGVALVVTGEGRIDSQTADDKAPLGVTSVAKQFNIPVIGIIGVLGGDVEVAHQYDIDVVFSILPRLVSLTEVLASGEANLFSSARNVACTIKIGQGIKN